MLAANPPFQAADEFEHFFRAIQLSEGTLVGTRQGEQSGGELPAAVNAIAFTGDMPGHPNRKVTWEYFAQKARPMFFDWSDAPRAYLHFPHTVVYAATGYLPQTAGVFLGKLIGIGPLGLMYVARLCVFGTSLVLGYTALRRLPAFRWVAAMLLLSPMNLYLMGTAAPDGILISSAFLLVALLLPMWTQASLRTGWRGKAGVLVLAAVLATTKFVYFPLALIVPVLVIPRLRSLGEQAWFGLAWVVTSALPTWLWLRAMETVYVPGRSDILIDPHAQVMHIATHPFSFLALAAKSMINNWRYLSHSFAGLMGWNDTMPPEAYVWVFWAGLLLCLLLEARGAVVIHACTRVAMLLTGIAAVLLVYAAQYASWNSPGATDGIQGIVGRYFWPIAPSLFFCFPPLQWLSTPDRAVAAVGVLLSLAGVGTGAWMLVSRYYLS